MGLEDALLGPAGAGIVPFYALYKWLYNNTDHWFIDRITRGISSGDTVPVIRETPKREKPNRKPSKRPKKKPRPDDPHMPVPVDYPHDIPSKPDDGTDSEPDEPPVKIRRNKGGTVTNICEEGEIKDF